jgi:hypothetical protein
VHERFTTQDSEKGVSHRFGFTDQSIHRRKIDLGLLSSDIDPATLASKIAGVDYRDVQEGRKELTLLEPLFMFPNRTESSPES